MAPMKIPAVAVHPTRQKPKDKDIVEGLDKAQLELEKMVVQLSFDQGKGELNGTGFYVNLPGAKEDIILTAAHNLISETKQRSTALCVLGSAPIAIPDGKFEICSKYEKNPGEKEAVNDYGAIFVPRIANNQAKPGFGYSLKLGIDEDLKGRVHVTGYKGREKKATPTVPAGTASDLGELVESSGRYAGDGSQLLYEADTEQGMSGSPVWVEYNGYPTVVGIHNHNSEKKKGKNADQDKKKKRNRGTQINLNVLRDVCRWAGIDQFDKRLRVKQDGARPQGIYLNFSMGVSLARVRVGAEGTSTFDILPAYTKTTATNTMPLYAFFFHQPTDWKPEYYQGQWVRWQPLASQNKVVLTKSFEDACLVRITPGPGVPPFRIAQDQTDNGKDVRGLRVNSANLSDQDVEKGMVDTSEVSFGPDMKGRVVKDSAVSGLSRGGSGNPARLDFWENRSLVLSNCSLSLPLSPSLTPESFVSGRRRPSEAPHAACLLAPPWTNFLLFELSRDNLLWRLHCYESSWKAAENGFSVANTSGILSLSSLASLGSLGQGTLRNLIQPGPQPAAEAIDSYDDATAPSIGQRSRAAADWDPSYSTESIDWYSEYIARNGPISFSWLQRPLIGDTNRDAKGMGLLRDWSSAREDRVVAPLDDGSVCIWDLNYSHSSSSRSRKGKIAGISHPGILITDLSKRSDKSPPRNPPLEFLSVGECVNVDSMRRRAYISVGNVLNEVDLETLRVVHQQRYAWSIFALSQETDYSVPLTLATTLSLQIYDARLSSPEEEAEISLRCEKHPAQFLPRSNLYSHPDTQVLQLLPNGQPPQRIRSPEPQEKGADYAPLFQPGPLSILHPPSPHVNTILLAGRFPSILCYDRRTFPKLQAAVHSGGRLCGLASIPPPSFPVSYDSNWQSKHTVVACGEYNGRGSLELYDLDFHGTDPQDKNSESNLQSPRYQNRQSASSSKVLSVASHGARIVFSDSGGNINWVERDGRSEVRRWNINSSRRQATNSNNQRENTPSGMFWRAADSSTRNDVARKILPTDANLNGDELLVWTEDRIGRLRFSNDENDGGDESDDEINDRMSEDGDEIIDPAQRQARRESREAMRRREQEYSREMRRALERQADEVRWMGRLGMA
ncbi:hypothetical protein UA08_03759 [Talaromyces atroroseus]|uniref:Serine protease n=1 Tax=Talaromyces atroroseus TaxID=1441469 RepID=A0A225ASG9_TALAT|nr:hypothetical protein UA08_03759 [Talaromyces atroroseus]OKL61294.1 hypothetical protein UA08_03759 [Talaromyces atroroseus]